MSQTALLQPRPEIAGKRAGRPATRRRSTWRVDSLLLLVGYALYSVIRNTVPGHVAIASAHGRAVLAVEHRLHLDLELSANRFVADHRLLAVVANYYYSSAHFAVTVAVAVWLYRRHARHARRLLATWYAATAAGLLGFWLFPLAPPRLLDGGFVDTVVVLHTWGSWGSGPMAAAANQYAAMPSLHIAWSLWCALALARYAKAGWLRAAGVAYPLLTLLVVVGTANHYLVDAAGGALAVLAGSLLVHGAARLAARRGDGGGRRRGQIRVRDLARRLPARRPRPATVGAAACWRAEHRPVPIDPPGRSLPVISV